jgi:hypothetical protein
MTNMSLLSWNIFEAIYLLVDQELEYYAYSYSLTFSLSGLESLAFP